MSYDVNFLLYIFMIFSNNLGDVKNAGLNGGKKREAVYDRGEQIKNNAAYVPKVEFTIVVFSLKSSY